MELRLPLRRDRDLGTQGSGDLSTLYHSTVSSLSPGSSLCCGPFMLASIPTPDPVSVPQETSLCPVALLQFTETAAVCSEALVRLSTLRRVFNPLAKPQQTAATACEGPDASEGILSGLLFPCKCIESIYKIPSKLHLEN